MRAGGPARSGLLACTVCLFALASACAFDGTGSGWVPDDDLDPGGPSDDGAPDTPPLLPDSPDSGRSEPTCQDVCVGGTCSIDGVCIIDCSERDACPAPITCPAGFDCDVRCIGESSCSGGVDCGGALDCNVNCDGLRSCTGPVHCGAKRCRVRCMGDESCDAGVECEDSGACEVRCDDDCSPKTACPTGCGGRGDPGEIDGGSDDGSDGCTASGSCDVCV
jgi:hypothetical protein